MHGHKLDKVELTHNMQSTRRIQHVILLRCAAGLISHTEYGEIHCAVM